MKCLVAYFAPLTFSQPNAILSPPLALHHHHRHHDHHQHHQHQETVQRCIQVFKFGGPLDPFLKNLGVHCKILGVQLINIQELIFDLLSLNCCSSTLSDF